MILRLTPKQRHLLRNLGDQPVPVLDPDSNTEYVLVRGDAFAKMQTQADPRKGESGTRVPRRIAKGIKESRRAFFRRLPQLLKQRKYRGQWVAFHRRRCLGFATTETALYEKCRGLGLRDTEFFVGWIGNQSEEPEIVEPSLFEFTDFPTPARPAT